MRVSGLRRDSCMRDHAHALPALIHPRCFKISSMHAYVFMRYACMYTCMKYAEKHTHEQARAPKTRRISPLQILDRAAAAARSRARRDYGRNPRSAPPSAGMPAVRVGVASYIPNTPRHTRNPHSPCSFFSPQHMLLLFSTAHAPSFLHSPCSFFSPQHMLLLFSTAHAPSFLL